MHTLARIAEIERFPMSGVSCQVQKQRPVTAIKERVHENAAAARRVHEAAEPRPFASTRGFSADSSAPMLPIATTVQHHTLPERNIWAAGGGEQQGQPQRVAPVPLRCRRVG